MKLKVEALDAFAHNRMNVRCGDTLHVGESDAHELEKVGLVKILGQSDREEEGHDDLVGGKQDKTVTQNKMADNPKNKAR